MWRARRGLRGHKAHRGLQGLKDRRVRRGLRGVIGKEAQEASGFVPTRHELIQVANYWANRKLEVGMGCLHYRETHDTELRLLNFAEDRIGHIAYLLGGNDLDTAIEKVFAQSGENQRKELWHIYEDARNARRLAARRDDPTF